MKQTLTELFEHKTLTKSSAKQLLTDIAQSQFNNSQIAAILSVYLMRSITVEELEGFRDALLELCLPVDFAGYDTIDLCGTGGDSKDTFNISTLSSFVVAGAGLHVTKHGNYGVSSVSGSSNVMEYFGYQFTNDSSKLLNQLETCGICFLHAPLFHPAMKNVAPVRRELGVKTFFNMLGPLVNPAKPVYQSVGVFSLELSRLYQYLLQKSTKKYTIVHSLDGYDEISLTGKFKLISNSGENIFEPADFGFTTLKQEELFGGATIAEAASVFSLILHGKGTKAQNDGVVANSAIAIYTAGEANNYSEAISIARESLESGKALKVFRKLIEN